MKNNKKVMGFGTFDGIHPGHLSCLLQLRELGDEVFVIVARKSSVEKIKGRLPRFDEKRRINDLKRTGMLDHALLGDKNDFYKCIKEIKPNIIGLGYDQQADLDEIKKMFPEIQIVRLKAFKPEKHKSSILNFKF